MKNQLPENQDEEQKQEENIKSTTRIYFYIAAVCCALGAVAFGLTFTALGIYSLIAAILLEIAALAFSNTQQRKNNFKAVFYVKVITYALLIAFLVFFIGGIIYGSYTPTETT